MLRCATSVEMERPYSLSCHCGQIRFEVDVELSGLRECNCSTCRRWGYILWYVPAKAVRLLTEKRALSAYVWRFLPEGHHFCPSCGTPIMRTGYPNQVVGINARCLEGVDVFDLDVERFDGRHEIPPGPLP